MKLAAKVSAALRDGKAVVALESTIIAHGFSWPKNFELARSMEETVESEGAVAATVAIIDGEVRVGLSAAETESLARAGADMGKANAADACIFIARGASAATTVSATASIAHAAGIAVFATGGIGGVHRGTSGDVSQDLAALARVPMVVVSAGAKAILDLPRTVEALETLGVLVVGYGTSQFPAFYCRESGVALEHRVDGVVAVANLVRAHRSSGHPGALLLVNPIPEPDQLPHELVDGAIGDALAAAAAAGVSGKALTPFLLREVAQRTQGAAEKANIALALANARLAAQVAVAAARLA